jgi:hypothetical protein
MIIVIIQYDVSLWLFFIYPHILRYIWTWRWDLHKQHCPDYICCQKFRLLWNTPAQMFQDRVDHMTGLKK